MSSRLAAARHSAASQENSAATPVAGIRAAVPVDAAANDDTPTSAFALFGDPLLGMAIASVILFVTLAALIAFS